MNYIEIPLEAYLKVNYGIINPNRVVIIQPFPGYTITLVNCSICESDSIKGFGIADGKEYVDTIFTSKIRIPIEMLIDEVN